MQNGNWSRLLVEALIVFCIGMGSILLWDSGSLFTKSGLSWKQQWRVVLEQANNDTTPSQVCAADEPIVIRQNVIGKCRILNGRQTCCTSTPPITPDIPIGSCSSRCLNLYAAYWCVVSCQGNFNTLNGTASLCSIAVQTLLDECQTCVPALLPYVTPVQFSEAVFIRVTPNNIVGCYDFAAIAAPAELGPPVIVSLNVVTSGGGASNNPNNFPFRATLIVEVNNGDQVPWGGEIACINPAGKPGKRKILTSNDFVLLGNGNWQTSATCNFGPKVSRSTWNFFVRIENTNSTATSDNAASTAFEINSDYVPPGGSYGNVLLCEADSADATGVSAISFTEGQSALTVTCCAVGQTCFVAGRGTIQTLVASAEALEISSYIGIIVNLILPAISEGLVLSGSASITITGRLDCETKIFGTDSSQMTVSNGGVMEASRGCLFDVSTLNIDFLASSAGVLVQGTPGDTIEEPSFEIQQGTANTGAVEFQAQFLISVNAIVTINGRPNTLVADFVLGITFENPLDASNGNQIVFIAGGIVFGSSHAGFILQHINLAPEAPPARNPRATTKPTGLAVVICNGPGNAIAGNQKVLATDNTGVFIQPKTQGAPDCGVRRRYRLVNDAFDPPNIVDPNAADAGWLVNAYFGNEFVPETAWASYPTDPQRQIVRLEIQNNARLVTVNARQGGAFTVVYGAIKFDQGSTIEVELAQQNVASDAFEIVLMRYQTSHRCNVNPGSCSADQCDTFATLVVSNPIINRPATLICRNYRLTGANAATPTGWKELVLQFPAAPVQTPPSTAVLPFLSSLRGAIVMDRTITDYPVERFLAALNNILGITPAEVLIESYAAVQSDRTRAQFRCRSAVSEADANAKCQRIINEANTQGSALANELRPVSSTTSNVGTETDDGSDEALYGLFALAAIPIICIVLLCLFMKNRRRQADNQYMQDTATFSNVAAQPQPINNPYPYYDPNAPAQALMYDGKIPSLPPPPAYPQYGY